MSTWKLVFGILIGVFVLMSLLPYGERTNPKSDPALAIEAPQEVMQILKRSCYDCHSNQTKWPWYSYVFPLSWSIKDHVKNGRASLNFDVWKKYDEKKRSKLRYEIGRRSGTTMPLEQYLWFHKDAALSKDEVRTIQKWAFEQSGFEQRNLR